MSSLSIRLPDSLHRELRKVARREGVSINQVVVMAVTRQVLRGSLEQFIAGHGGPVSREELLALLDTVPDGPPLPGDELLDS